MRSTVNNFRNLLRKHFEEGIDRVRRHRYGRGDEESFDDYHDLPEDVGEEGIDRVRRHRYGRGDEESFDDYHDLPEGDEKDGRMSDEEEKYVKAFKKSQATGDIPKINPKTGRRSNIYAMAKAAAEKNESRGK